MARVSYSDAVGDRFVVIVQRVASCGGIVLDVACGPQPNLKVPPQVLESIRS